MEEDRVPAKELTWFLCFKDVPDKPQNISMQPSGFSFISIAETECLRKTN